MPGYKKQMHNDVIKMEKGLPTKDELFPNISIPSLCYIKNAIKNPNIIVGDYTYYSELPQKGDTIVGNDVWIGQNVTIMPGVRIGDGAIIGTNSTVASDVPPYSIAVGNPARVIKKRFDDEMIDLLEKLDELLPLLGNGYALVILFLTRIGSKSTK